MKLLYFIFTFILFSCSGQENKNQLRNNAKIKPIEPTNNSSASSQYVSLPFDYEKYKKICIQEGSPDCSKIYPVLGQSEFDTVVKIIGITEGNPESIFQIQPASGSTVNIYVLNFQGDSSSQELVTVSNNKVIGRQSIGYAMPEEETYETFTINPDMTVDIYEISFTDSSNKKKKEKYKIAANGSISKIK